MTPALSKFKIKCTHTSLCGRGAADQQHECDRRRQRCHRRRRRRSAPSQIARVSSHCDAGCAGVKCGTSKPNAQWLIIRLD